MVNLNVHIMDPNKEKNIPSTDPIMDNTVMKIMLKKSYFLTF